MEKAEGIFLMKLLYVTLIMFLAFLMVSGVQASTQNITPSQDAGTKSVYPNNNYGNDWYFNIGFSSLAGTLNTWLKFNLASIDPAKIQSAKLYIYCYGLSGSFSGAIWLSATDSWNENTITHNNQPSVTGSVLDTVSITGQNCWYSWSVTDKVKQEAQGDDIISFKLNASTSTIYNDFCNFYSKEYSNSAYRPYLQITLQEEQQPPPSPEPEPELELSFNNLPYALSIRLGIPLFAAQLLTSMGILMFFETIIMASFLVLSKGEADIFLPSLLTGISVLGLCVVLGWFPIWIYTVQVLLIACLWGKM